MTPTTAMKKTNSAGPTWNIAHAIHGHDHRWLLNEKGAVAATERLPSAPADFAAKAASAIGALAATEKDLTTACDLLERLNEEALSLLA